MHDNHQSKNLSLNNQGNPKPNYKAFTLIELVMVIVLIAILAAVTGPRFFSLTSFNEKFFTQDVLSALRYARLTAEVSNCRVQFNVVSNGFNLKQNLNCQNPTVAADFSLTVKRPSEPDQAYVSTERPSSLTVDVGGSPTATILFLPSGIVTNAAGTLSSFTLSFTGAEVAEVFIVEGGTGFVH